MKKSKATEKIIYLMKKQGISKPFWKSYLFGVRVELNELPKKLQKNENLFSVIPCTFRGRRGIIAITTLRVIVLNCGYFGIFSNNFREDVYYTQSAGGSTSGGFISSYSISVYGNGNDIEVTNLWGRDAQVLDKWYNHARKAYESHVNENNEKANNERKFKEIKDKLIQKLNSSEITKDEYKELIEELKLKYDI